MRYINRVLFAILVMSLPFLASSQTRDRGLSIKVGTTKDDVTAKREVNLWAVVIGISRYKFGDEKVGKDNQISNLKNATEDATEIYKFLRSEEGGNFPESNISLLLDEQATKANVEVALEKLKQSKPNDYFVVFIAAHGVIWQEPGASGRTEEFPYFVLHDTDPRAIPKTSIRMEQFKRTVNNLPAKKGLVISDTCHSAGVMLEGRALAVTQRAQNQWLAQLNEIPRGIGYLSAADQNESSLERDELGHGVFTYCLLEAVRGNADFDADGKVTFEEVRTYVRDEVPKLTNNRQHPQYATNMLSANYLPLAVVTYPTVGNCSAASPCGTLRITNPEVDGVEIFVDDKPLGKLATGGQRTVRVPVGERRLTLAKGSIKQTQPANVEPNKTTSYEINAAFTQNGEDELVPPSAQQNTVSLGEEKPPAPNAKEKLQAGVDLFNKQKFKEAIALFNEAVKLNGGGYHQAYTYRGRAEQSLGLKEDAIKSFGAALTIRPTDYQTKTLLAEAKFNAGRNTEEVVKELRTITKDYSRYEFAFVVLGDVLFARGDKIGAEKALRKAISINPKFPPAHLILAHVLMEKDAAATVINLGEEVPAVPWKEAVGQAEEALRLFNEVAKKKVSALKAAKYMSISHVIFGGARYADNAALAEANYMLGKAYTRYARWNDNGLPDNLVLNYLDKGRVNIQEAFRLGQNLPDKTRLLLTYWQSAENALAKNDLARASKDAQAALKLADSMSDAELSGIKFAIYFTLYEVYEAAQEFTKAAEALRKGLAIYGNRLPPAELKKFNDMLRVAEENGIANRKKK